MNLDCNRKDNEMKAADLDIKDVTVIRTEKRCVLNEKVFDLDNCPDWAEWAAVDEDGTASWYGAKPETVGSVWINDGSSGLIGDEDRIVAIIFDAADWKRSLIERPKKVLEVTMSDIEKQFGCKVKIVKEAE